MLRRDLSSQKRLWVFEGGCEAHNHASNDLQWAVDLIYTGSEACPQ